ncbi:hypothetical protein B4U80_04469, partial [Leptotrombidium deliense]
MGPRIISSNKSITPSEITIQKLIFNKLQEYGCKTHLVEYETGKTTTFSMLLSDCLKLSSALVASNIKPGDVFIVYGFNSYEFLVALISGIFVGAIAVSMRALDTDYEVKDTILMWDAKCLFVTSQKYETAMFVKQQLPNFKNIFIFDTEQKDFRFPTIRQLIDSSTEMEEHNIYEPKNKDEFAVILESSGTTGAMKGTKLGHYDLATLYDSRNTSTLYKKADVFSGHSHMAHLSGLGAHLRSITFGIKIVSIRQSNVEKLVDAIRKYRITRLIITPSTMNLMNKLENVDNLNSLKHVFVGGSRVTQTVINNFLKKFNVEEFRNVYTMTEVTILSTLSDNKINCEAIGKVCPGIQMKVINPATGRLLGENESGELCIKGPIKFKGYHKNEKATKELIDEEGWIHTGDIGYFDDDENFFLVDRLKDIIKQHGYSYSPVDIEDVLLQHEAVKEAAVIGIPYGIDEEISHAFVVL